MTARREGDARVARRKYKRKHTFRNLEGEEWKLVEGTEDYYVSNMGRFRRGDQLRKTNPNSEGYCRCHMAPKKKLLHRLVAEAFVPNPNNLPVVDHIDGDKMNNKASNLRWVTPQENTQAAYDLGIHVASKGHKNILAYNENDEFFLYENQQEAAKGTGVSPAGVFKILKGHEKSRNGFKFLRVTSIEDRRINKKFVEGE